MLQNFFMNVDFYEMEKIILFIDKHIFFTQSYPSTVLRE